ncbi:metallophosphoesterase [Haladaptatus pallidirubidus]|uniref:Calcineurin-like phosphoesterase domain-containing protein n=1 Tax=Haladaptatus pallidirubidus TaxID=1008152 RepID=A0AAV3UBI0_9EURY|nr:metallophosphoesterase [Haladaptatus pallidirubidus]
MRIEHPAYALGSGKPGSVPLVPAYNRLQAGVDDEGYFDVDDEHADAVMERLADRYDVEYDDGDVVVPDADGASKEPDEGTDSGDEPPDSASDESTGAETSPSPDSVPRFGTLSARPPEAPHNAVFIETDESQGEPGARWRYDENIGEWVKQPVNTDVANVEAVNAERVSSNEVNIGPLKVGYFTDSHWGAQSGQWSDTLADLQSKIDTFVADMNSWGEDGADLVIWGGDMIQEDASSLSTSQQRIDDFRNYAESQLNCPAHMVWGNHEYAKVDDWGEDWSYSNWGVSSLEETYYSLDYHHAKLIVLNTGYNDGSRQNLRSMVPPGQYSWLKSELKSTEKPVLIWTHTPSFLGGAMSAYDNLLPESRSKYSQLLSEHDNITTVFYAHCHHQNTYGRDPLFTKSTTQFYDGVRYFYQHYPHSVGIVSRDADFSVTPYGKIKIYQDGHVSVEQSYSKDETGYQDKWRFNGTTRPQSTPLVDNLKWTHEGSFDSLDAYRLNPSESTGGSIKFHQSGVVDFAQLQSGTDGTNSILEYRRQPRALLDDTIDWPDMVWYVVMEIPNISTAEGWVTRGGIGTAPHIGLRITNGEVCAHVADGTAEGLGNQPLATNGTKRLFQCRYNAEKSVAQFAKWSESGMDGIMEQTIDNNPPLDQTTEGSPEVNPYQLLNCRIGSTDASQSELRIYDWGISLDGPGSLDFKG